MCVQGLIRTGAVVLQGFSDRSSGVGSREAVGGTEQPAEQPVSGSEEQETATDDESLPDGRSGSLLEIAVVGMEALHLFSALFHYLHIWSVNGPSHFFLHH